jgi:hydrogenase expression/formation protein HypE
MLGLDPMYCANEGKLICIVAHEDAEKVLTAMRETEEGRDAALIGRVSGEYPGKLVLETEFGGKRVLQKLTGAQLPRIC